MRRPRIEIGATPVLARVLHEGREHADERAAIGLGDQVRGHVDGQTFVDRPCVRHRALHAGDRIAERGEDRRGRDRHVDALVRELVVGEEGVRDLLRGGATGPG